MIFDKLKNLTPQQLRELGDMDLTGVDLDGLKFEANMIVHNNMAIKLFGRDRNEIATLFALLRAETTQKQREEIPSTPVALLDATASAVTSAEKFAASALTGGGLALKKLSDNPKMAISAAGLAFLMKDGSSGLMKAGFMVALIYMLLKSAGSPLADEMEKIGGDLLAELTGKSMKAGPSVEMADQVTTGTVTAVVAPKKYERSVKHGITTR